MITLEAGRTVAGKYCLERPLAKGGMGAVWIARHVLLDVVVAVKFMDPDTAASAEARMRFEREAKASAQLKSPHVVQVHDYGIEDDTPYLVMELLDGEDLSARLRREPRLSLAATSTILAQLGKGLRRAHEAGIVHRDLKPSNIFLQRQDEEIVVKILDFGIAKSVVPNKPLVGDATKTGLTLGSPPFMSPEQLRNAKAIDHRTDLWALGVILFRCLTGRLPFQADDIANLIVCICVERIPSPSEFAPDLGPEVDRFFERALARDPNQRFQTVKELVDAFAALPGARGQGVDWTDPRSSQPLLPGSEGSGTPPGMAVAGQPSSASGASGGVSSPHLLEPGSSGTGRTGSGKRGIPVLAAAIGAAILAAAIGVALFLRGAPAQAPSSAGVVVPSNGRGVSVVSESSPSPEPEPSRAASQTAEPSVTPAVPAASASTTASVTGPAAATGVSGKAPPSGAGRPPGAKEPAKRDPQNAILGF